MFTKKGIHFALLASVISGFSIFINKFAVNAISSPLIFTTVKNTGVALVILGFLFLSGKWKLVRNLSKKDTIQLLLIGVIGGSIPFYLFFKGLSMIPAVNGAIIQKSLVLWVCFLAVPFLGEKLSKKGWFAVSLLFAGNVLIGGFKGFNFSSGEFFVLIATVFWAFETVISKKLLPKVDTDLLVEARMGFGAIILLVISFVLQPHALVGVFSLTLDKWFWVGITTLFLLAYLVVWYRGLKYAPATLATAILVGSTLITNMLSAIFITHTLNLALLVQAILMGLGIFVIYKFEAKAKVSSNPRLAR